jgi:hypothetical protein
MNMDDEKLTREIKKFYKEHPELLEVIRKYNIDKENYYKTLQSLNGKRKITYSTITNRTY